MNMCSLTYVLCASDFRSVFRIDDCDNLRDLWTSSVDRAVPMDVANRDTELGARSSGRSRWGGGRSIPEAHGKASKAVSDKKSIGEHRGEFERLEGGLGWEPHLCTHCAKVPVVVVARSA